MLVSVVVRTRQGASLTLPLEDTSAGFIINEVEGLNPVKATLVSSSFANSDGEQYHSSRREARDIKLKMSLEPDYITQTVRGLRNILYRYLMPKSEVTLRFVDSDESYVEIDGRVESFDTPLFTNEPAVDISLRCFDPDLIDPTPVIVSGNTVSTNAELLIDYEGTVDTGIALVIPVNRTLNEFTVYHRPADGTLRTMDFAAPLLAGDVLRISTVSGERGATRTRAGVVTSLLYGISPQSNWHELQQGDNYIRVYATGAAIPYTIEYTTRYGGL